MRNSAIAGASCLALLALTGPAASPLTAQDSATVIADPSIGRGGLRRFFLGDHYRDLWTMPLKVPRLDLSTEAGGLTPLRRGGGLQTKSLRLRGGDGREYVFRLLLKDPTTLVPQELRETMVEDIIRDQMSAMHPGAALVVPPILDAAGVLHVTPRFFLMPDDSRLGEFRAEFGNQFGMLEERPTGGDDDTPGFAGAEEILDTPELIEALWDRPWVRVDARAYLTARLLDLYFGDWDRHEDQWRWARVDNGQPRYLPIPRDRDQAFVRYDGVLLSITRQATPQLLVFDEDYAHPMAATWNGRNLDRRLLAGLGREVWDSTARELQRAITDSVIDSAVNRLPAEYLARNGEWLREMLIRRRDQLPEAALETYEFLARDVRIQAGDRDDHAEVERREDGRTDLKLRRGRGDVYFHRVFDPEETREIHLDLRGGDDRLVIRGQGGGGPLLRVVGGRGADSLTDSSSSRRSRFYDSGDATVAIGGGVDRKPYVQASDTNPAALPERDWGSRRLGMPLITYSTDIGLTLGYAWSRWGYGFRRQPYASSLRIAPEYSLGRSHGRLDFQGRWKLVNRDRYITLGALASGIEVLHFYGFGNDTRDTADKSFYRIENQVVQLNPALGFGLESRSELQIGIMARHTRTDPNDDENRAALISQVQPLGMGDFGQLGLRAVYEWDTRDYPQLPTRGLRFHVEAAYYPLTWSNGQDGFGTIDGVASTFLSPGGQDWLTFAVRAGGRHTYGEVPYFEQAQLGGRYTLRGYPRNRFTGNSSAFGAVEARLRLLRAFLILPGDLGVFGLGDVGRVFVDDDTDSGDWHSDLGGGLYYSTLKRSGVVVVGAAQGDEGVRVYVGLGLGY